MSLILVCTFLQKFVLHVLSDFFMTSITVMIWHFSGWTLHICLIIFCNLSTLVVASEGCD